MNISISTNYTAYTDETEHTKHEGKAHQHSRSQGAEEALFQRLLSGNSDTTSKPNIDNTALPLNPFIDGAPKQASIQTGSTKTHSSVTSVSQLVSQVSSAIAEVSAKLNSPTQSFTLLIPGQGSLNVTTTLTPTSLRAFQLNSEDEEFQNWLEQNANDIAEALSMELGSGVSVSSGGSLA